ncbi:hypothetical protein R1sor_004670 [Riccia sorocarpa]|uniref:Uncharacterized protein n=1 Tax=Riccia sorocarpa TaxID=122646 RepID=A0ABD3HKU7_9MARC
MKERGWEMIGVDFEGLEPPHVLAVRSYSDFTQRRDTPAIPTARPDCPDLNFEEQVFLQCTQQKKKRVGGKDGCGHIHKWRGPTSKAQWLAQVFGDIITSEY